MSKIEALLTVRIGLDPSTVGTGLIRRAVGLRMEETGTDDLEAYLRLVERSESEIQALVEEVVIPESWFFRDEQPFQVFREYVRSRWLAEPARPPLRALSMPCAGGEEPYSLAIALRELGLPGSRFRIDAVDVSRRRLAHASCGLYTRNAFRAAELGYRDRYFRAGIGGFQIDAEIRAGVRFIAANVLDPDLLRSEPPYDVIFCRNLLIYLDPASRAWAVATLDRLLAADGLLVVGHADRPETGPGGEARRFVPFGGVGSFAYCRARPADPGVSRPLPKLLALPAPPIVAAAARQARAPQSDGPRSAASPPRPSTAASTPPPRVPARPPRPEVPTPSLLDQASDLANRGEYGGAIAICERHIRSRGPDAAAYHLMGVILQAGGDRKRSEECYLKAVYLDPAHDEALLALALIAERRGDAASARSFRRRAERALLKKGAR